MTTSNFAEAARRTIRLEAEAVTLLEERIDAPLTVPAS